MSLLMKIVTVCIGVFILFTPLYLGHKSSDSVCTGLEITIADSARHRFVTEADIMNLVRSTGIRVTGMKRNEIPLAAIEQKVRTFKELKVAEVWFSTDRKLHVYGNQREPVMRVVASYGGDFFIDREGVIMRRHNLYTPHLHIVEVDMLFSPDQMTGMNIYDSDKTENLIRAFELVNFITADSFWDSMIDHISISRSGRVTMVPRVGNHIIELGKAEDYQEKFNNLLVFYSEAMPKAGWDRYKRVNIEYKGQVVCQRR